MGTLLGWLSSFLLLMAVIGIVGYQLMNLMDLETDHINPYDSTRQINKIVTVEYVLQGLVCVTFLFTGHWFMCLLSLPYLYHNTTLYLRRRHLLDVTEIYNQLNWEKKQRIFKLFYLVAIVVISLFCVYIYDAVSSYERVGYSALVSGSTLVMPFLDNQLKSPSPLLLPAQDALTPLSELEEIDLVKTIKVCN